ncbi:MAG: hypothetical protein ACE5HG_01810 [Candidatus Bathyarchaeia archaeon]
MKLGDPYTLSCGHKGKIVWISKDEENFAVKARTGAGSCCNRKSQNGTWNPTVFLIKKSDKNPHTYANTSHLTTLVSRFLKTLQNMKFWNQLDTLKGEAKLRHHLSNIMEYTFYFHKQQITEQEVEKLIHLLEKKGTNHEA